MKIKQATNPLGEMSVLDDKVFTRKEIFYESRDFMMLL